MKDLFLFMITVCDLYFFLYNAYNLKMQMLPKMYTGASPPIALSIKGVWVYTMGLNSEDKNTLSSLSLNILNNWSNNATAVPPAPFKTDYIRGADISTTY